MSMTQRLFAHMAREHGLTLLDSEMHEIERIVNAGRSVLEWQPASDVPDADVTVFLGFADGDIEQGFYDGTTWRSMETVQFPADDQPVAWAHVPDVPQEFLALEPNQGPSASAPLRETK